MNCREFRQKIDDYLDRELTSEQGERFLAHKNRCAECRALVARREQLFEALEDNAATSWEVDIVAEVMAEVTRKPALDTVSPFQLPMVAAVAVAVTVGLLIFFFGIGSTLAGLSPMDALDGFLSIVELPDQVKDTLSQIDAVVNAMWLGIKAIASFVFQMLKILMKTFPYVVFPILILAVFAGFILWFNRSRAKKTLAVF